MTGWLVGIGAYLISLAMVLLFNRGAHRKQNPTRLGQVETAEESPPTARAVGEKRRA